jgi:hypothetical protein
MAYRESKSNYQARIRRKVEALAKTNAQRILSGLPELELPAKLDSEEPDEYELNLPPGQLGSCPGNSLVTVFRKKYTKAKPLLMDYVLNEAGAAK